MKTNFRATLYGAGQNFLLLSSLIFVGSCKKPVAPNHPVETKSAQVQVQAAQPPASQQPPASPLPAGNFKEPASVSFSLDDSGTSAVMTSDFVFGSSSWTVRSYVASTSIEHRDRSYGPYSDRETRTLYDALLKYLQWEEQAKDTNPPSFSKEIPGDLHRFHTDDSFAPTAVFVWKAEKAAEQDALGARLSALGGEQAKQESGPRAILVLNLSSQDRIWGRNLTTEEVREFVVCLEQVARCQKSFNIEYNQKMGQKFAARKKEQQLMDSFK